MLDVVQLEKGLPLWAGGSLASKAIYRAFEASALGSFCWQLDPRSHRLRLSQFSGRRLELKIEALRTPVEKTFAAKICLLPRAASGEPGGLLGAQGAALARAGLGAGGTRGSGGGQGGSFLPACRYYGYPGVFPLFLPWQELPFVHPKCCDLASDTVEAAILGPDRHSL